MKQILLAIALVAVPVGIFAAGYRYLSPTSEVAQSANLGDLGNLKSIVSDVQSLSSSGDLNAAATRITDFEKAWDDAQSTLRPLNPTAWGNVDEAADIAIKSLRKTTPDSAAVTAALAGLMTKLTDPTGQVGVGANTAILVDGITITGPDGRPQPCEVMIKQLDQAVAAAKLTDGDAAKVTEFKSKALERCNADDDLHADEFSAHGIALATR